MALRSLFALIAVAVALASSGCDGGSTPLPRPSVPALYEMTLTSPATLVQLGQPFTIVVDCHELGGSNPYAIDATEEITAAVFSGPGLLGGTTQRTGSGASSIAFDDLTLSSTGTHFIEFRGTRAGAPVMSAAVHVEPRMQLHFAVVPTMAIRGRPFSVTIQTVDPITKAVVAPITPVQVKIERDPATGHAPLSAPSSVPISVGVALVTTLTYPVAEQIALRASAPGLGVATSPTFIVDAMQLVPNPTPGNVLVNGTFMISMQISGLITGAPIAPQPALSASLAVASGPGALSGGTTALSSGSSLVFSGLRYNQLGTASFGVNSLETAAITTAPIAFGVGVTVSATGPTVVPPSGAFNPLLFRVVDGQGVTWTGSSGPLTWVLRDTLGTSLQTAAVPIAAGIAFAHPQPVATTGSYQVEGSMNWPSSASATIGLSVNSLVLVNTPGPFVSLKSCRVGTLYSDSVSFAAPPGATGYGIFSGTLPTGLVLSGSTGTVSGTPTVAGSYSFTLFATLPGGQCQPIRCALAVFTLNESEIVPGQTFRTPGPYAVNGPFTENFTFISSYDAMIYPSTAPVPLPWAPCRVEYFFPSFAQAPSPAPVYIHHRGRGFNMVDYRALAAHVASYGFIFVSVEDYVSFADGGLAGQPDTRGNPSLTATATLTYDSMSPERGMMSASAFQEAAMQWLAVVNAAQTHNLFGRVDTERLFAGGHSRGGGATHASHVRSTPYFFGSQRENLNLRGVVYFMAFDLRFFSSTVGGGPTNYAVPTAMGRLPSLMIAAENDGDLYYPICDQFIDRAQGPATFATVYGGCHAFLTDHGIYDAAGAAITRQQQQQRMFGMVVAFLKRWSNLDLSLDGVLYNNEFAASRELGVTAWRNMMEATMIDNHQGGNAAVNQLGGSNSITGGSYTISGSVYPSVGHYFTMGLRHNIVTISGGSTVVYSTSIPGQHQNQNRSRRLVFRCGAVDVGSEPMKGFDWTTVSVRATGGPGVSATIVLFDRVTGVATDLPDYTGDTNVFDRFIDVSIKLSRFTQANPAFSKSQITKIELIFDAGGTNSRQFYFDDLRFE